MDSGVAREFLMREPDTIDINGIEVIGGRASCGYTSPYHYCTEMIAVASENVFFSVTVKQDDAEPPLLAIRDSLQLLPSGYTTVPFAVGEPNGPVANHLPRMGLVPDMIAQGTELSGRQTVVRTSPEGGAVVRIGDTVKIFVK